MQTESALFKPKTSGLTKLDKPTGSIRLAVGATVVVGAAGALTTLTSRSGVDWASAQKAFAQLVYRVYNDTDFLDFGEWYGPKGYWPFCKANDNVTYSLGIDSNSQSESSYFLPTVTAVYTDVKASRVVVEMAMPSKAVKKYGSFKSAVLDLNFTAAAAAGGQGPGAGGSSGAGSEQPPQPLSQLEVAVSLTWYGKQPAMIGESASLLFAPAVALTAGRSGPNTSAWTMNKLGSHVDPEGVVQGGNQHNHAVWRG
eukprot:SAG22_NODE_3032_length_2012_cov_0.873497_1_plen_254_part_10